MNMISYTNVQRSAMTPRCHETFVDIKTSMNSICILKSCH